MVGIVSVIVILSQTVIKQKCTNWYYKLSITKSNDNSKLSKCNTM